MKALAPPAGNTLQMARQSMATDQHITRSTAGYQRHLQPAHQRQLQPGSNGPNTAYSTQAASATYTADRAPTSAAGVLTGTSQRRCHHAVVLLQGLPTPHGSASLRSAAAVARPQMSMSSRASATVSGSVSARKPSRSSSAVASG